MGEIKQTNFRIDSERADAFRAFCEENGLNQAQGFDHIMDVLAMNQAKEAVPERLVEIEEFEQHTKAILTGYMRSLEIAKNTELRVRENFANELIKKDKRIAELEEKVESKTLAAEEAKAEAKEAVILQKQAENEAEQAAKLLSAAEKTAADKVAMYEMSQKQLKETMDQLAEYPGLKAANDERAKKIEKLQQELRDSKREAEVSLERAVADAIKTKGQEITALEISLSKAQALAGEAAKQLEKLEGKNDKLQDTISELRVQVAELKTQNSFLEKQLETKKENK